MHYAEIEIIPLGKKAGYPTDINFENLSDRVNCFKDELSKIIDHKLGSWFRDLALTVYDELGVRKARMPMILMGRSEELRVNLIFNILFVIYICLINIIFIAWILWSERRNDYCVNSNKIISRNQYFNI